MSYVRTLGATSPGDLQSVVKKIVDKIFSISVMGVSISSVLGSARVMIESFVSSWVMGKFHSIDDFKNISDVSGLSTEFADLFMDFVLTDIGAFTVYDPNNPGDADTTLGMIWNDTSHTGSAVTCGIRDMLASTFTDLLNEVLQDAGLEPKPKGSLPPHDPIPGGSGAHPFSSEAAYCRQRALVVSSGAATLWNQAAAMWDIAAPYGPMANYITQATVYENQALAEEAVPGVISFGMGLHEFESEMGISQPFTGGTLKPKGISTSKGMMLPLAIGGIALLFLIKK